LSPKLHINFFSTHIHSFHFFGVIGFVMGTAFGCMLAWLLHLQVGIVLLMSAIGAATFFLLAFVAKWIAGKEVIVYYHHEISIVLLCAVTLYFLKKPVLPYLDITLLGIGVFLAFGRIGCYSVGCCHGRPHKHGVKYGQAHVNAGFLWYYKDVSLLPVQLIESGYVFFTVIVGGILLLNHVAPGTVLVCYTVIYGMMRYILEFFRGDPERPLWYAVSEAQWTTLLLVTVSLLLSISGFLPFYSWHWIILLSLIIASCYMMFVKSRTINYRLLGPKHIRQIAFALQYFTNAEKFSHQTKKSSVSIYTTQQGLSISSGIYKDEESQVRLYTISGKTKFKLNTRIANGIAKTIRLIKHLGEFELIEKENGIYHIVFKEEQKQKKILVKNMV